MLLDRKLDIEKVGSHIVDAAFKVHSTLGPGLLESAYQACLTYELRKRDLALECEVPLAINYGGQELATAYRIDMIVEKMVIIENKTIEHILPIHEAQILTYLRLGGYQLGFLINWNVIYFKSGIRRFVFNLPEPQWRIERKGKLIS